MSRIVVCDVAAAVETALLRAGHPVLRVNLPRSALALLLPSPARRAAEAFQADCLMVDAETPQTLAFAAQLGIRHIVAPADAAFLPDRRLPAPFFAARPPITGPAETMTMPLDIALISDAAAAQVADCMAAGCALVAPDKAVWRAMLGPAALFYDAAQPGAQAAATARVENDPTLRQRLGEAARTAFEARHQAAHAALVAAVTPL